MLMTWTGGLTLLANSYKKLPQHTVIFIPLDHWNHCLSSSSNDDRTDGVWEYAAEFVSGELVATISLLECQPSEEGS